MANAKSYSLGPGLSAAEQVAGFCYLPFYVVLLSLVLQWLSGLLGLGLTAVQLNLWYFVINCAMIWVIFHNFLIRSFHAIHFWELLQALILGYCLYFAGNWVFNWVVALLDLSITAVNNEAIITLIGQNQWIMLIGSVLLAPMTEETLVRGLLFGTVRRKSRIAAYAVSVLFFAVIHVWQYVVTYDLRTVVLAALQYIPAGIALGWTYEKCNTIWGPIFLHMVINAISFGVLKAL